MSEFVQTTIKDWWPFIVFVFGGVISFLIGKERQRWRVDEIGKEVHAQGKRIEKLEMQGTAEAVTLAEIKTAQGLILQQLTEIRGELRGKVDK